jgi:hypothetical protein
MPDKDCAGCGQAEWEHIKVEDTDKNVHLLCPRVFREPPDLRTRKQRIEDGD